MPTVSNIYGMNVILAYPAYLPREFYKKTKAVFFNQDKNTEKFWNCYVFVTGVQSLVQRINVAYTNFAQNKLLKEGKVEDVSVHTFWYTNEETSMNINFGVPIGRKDGTEEELADLEKDFIELYKLEYHLGNYIERAKVLMPQLSTYITIRPKMYSEVFLC